MRFNNNAQVRAHAVQLAAALAVREIVQRDPRSPIDVCKTCVTTAKMRLPEGAEEPFPPALLGQSKTSPLSAFCIVCLDAVAERDE